MPRKRRPKTRHRAAPTEDRLSATHRVVDPVIAGAMADPYVVVDLETTGTEPGRDETLRSRRSWLSSTPRWRIQVLSVS